MRTTPEDALRRHTPLLACCALTLAVLLAAGAAGLPATLAQSTGLGVLAAAQPSEVQAGTRVTYSVTVENGTGAALTGVNLRTTLPAGFDLVPGSTRTRANGLAVPALEPVLNGTLLTWDGLTVPAGRSGGVFGMHTFVQDYCESEYASQLDSVKALMRPGSTDPPAFVKQLFKDITSDTSGPDPCWVQFVDAAYDRDLIPVLRLEGIFGGRPGWVKPEPDADGSYRSTAEAYARVVAGLAGVPKRQGRPLYIEVWNEPNLNLEWSGAANPVEYGRFLVDVSAAIRALGDDGIHILNGGLSHGVTDAPAEGMSVESFIDGLARVPGALQAFDVWAVHPYPGNRPPQFNLHDGKAGDWPALTIDSYTLELERLAAHGRQDVQVLLTETGYALGANNLAFLGLPPIDEANRADYMVRAFRDYWSRWPEVLGVCPFQLVDPSGTWKDWDWLYPDGRTHTQYSAVQGLDKNLPGQLIVQFQVVANAPAGSYASRVEVSGTAGGEILPAAAPVRVVGTLPTPTPAPVTAACYPVLQNSGFENNSCWALSDTASAATFTSRRVHSGNRALQVGQVDGEPRDSYSSAQQAFPVPSSALSVRVRYSYFPISGDLATGKQYVLVQKGTQTVAFLKTAAEDRAQWISATQEITVTPEMAGQTLSLYLGVSNPAGAAGVTAMFVDDVQVEVCLPAGASAPPVTACPALARPQRLPLIVHGYRAPSAGATALVPALVPASADEPLPGAPTPDATEEAPWEPEPAAAPTGPVPHTLAELDGMAIDPAAWPSVLSWDATGGRPIAAHGATVWALGGPGGATPFETTLSARIEALAVDEASGWLWTTLPDVGTVVALDRAGQIVAHAEDLGRPTGLAVGDGRIYVADSIGRRLAVLDATSGAVLRWAELRAAPCPVAWDAATGRLFVGLMGEGAILVLQEDSLEPLGEVRIGGTGFPQQLVVDAAAGRLYVVHALSAKYGAVTAIDTQSLTVAVTRTGNEETSLVGVRQILVPPEGDLLLAAGGVLSILDREDLAVRGEDRSAPETDAWALDPSSGTMYAADGASQVTTWSADALVAGAVREGTGP